MKTRGRTGIVAAMQQELSAVLARLPDEQRQRVAGRDFWVGHHLVPVPVAGRGFSCQIDLRRLSG